MDLIVYSLIFCTFLVVLVSAILIYSRKEIIVKLKEKEQLKLRHQKEMLENSIQVQENHNKRVAQDLHDSINSKLAAIRLMLNELDANSSAAKNVQNKISDVMLSVREVSYRLLPPVLESFGLSQAIEELADDYSVQGDIRLQLSIDKKVDKTARFVQLQLYRIIQELLQNSIKYSQANTITVSIKIIENNIQFTYADNGQGFDLKLIEQYKEKSMGIKNIKSRASVINGDYLFFTSRGKGFKFSLNLQKSA